MALPSKRVSGRFTAWLTTDDLQLRSLGVGVAASGTTGYISSSAAGTVGAPVLSIASEATTGLFRPAANTWGIANAGVESARFTSGGEFYMGFPLFGAAAIHGARVEVQGNIPRLASFGATMASDTATDAPFYNTGRSRGTLAALALVTSGDVLAQQEFQGLTRVSTPLLTPGVRVRAEVDGTVALNSLPSRWVLSTSTTSTPVEAIRVNSVQNFSIGGGANTSATATDKFQVWNSGANLNCLFTAAGTGAQPLLRLRASRGTVAAPTITVAGDTIGSLIFQGYGTSFANSAILDCLAEGSISGVIIPGVARLRTANSSGSLVEVLRADSAQRVLMGLTAANGSTYKLEVEGGFARFAYNSSGAYPVVPTPTTELAGLAIGYNFSVGRRETNFWNLNYNASTTSFDWRQMTAVGVATTLMELSPVGVLTLGTNWVFTPATKNINGLNSTGTGNFITVQTNTSALPTWNASPLLALATNVSSGGAECNFINAYNTTGTNAFDWRVMPTGSTSTVIMNVTWGGDLTTLATIKPGTRYLGQSTSPASANDLTLGASNLNNVTGTTTINAIVTTGWTAGSSVTLIFAGALTVKHNTAGGGSTARIFLAGSVDLTTAANTVLGLVYDGTQWQETFRKVA